MTKLRKKLLLSVLTLALTFIALGSTTFAWFTLGSTATANAFEGTVQSGEGIEISLGADTETYANFQWTNNVNLSTALTEHTNLAFKDLTSVDGKAITGIKGATETATANTDYVEIPIYVRTVDSTLHIYLKQFVQTESVDFNWNPDATVIDATYGFAVKTPEAWNALNALRVSFTAEGTAANKTNATKVFEFALTSSDHGSADSSTDGVAYKYALAKGETLTNTGSTFPTPTKVDSLKVDKTSNELDVDLTSEGITYATYKATDESNAEGTTYYIYKIYLRVWMEGWDGDCINAILSKTVKLGFILEGKKTA